MKNMKPIDIVFMAVVVAYFIALAACNIGLLRL